MHAADEFRWSGDSPCRTPFAPSDFSGIQPVMHGNDACDADIASHPAITRHDEPLPGTDIALRGACSLTRSLREAQPWQTDIEPARTWIKKHSLCRIAKNFRRLVGRPAE